MISKLFALVGPTLGTLVLLLGWFLVADVFHLVTPLLLPKLGQVGWRLAEILVSGEVSADLINTIYRWFCGFVLGAGSGAALGLLLGVIPPLYRSLEFPLEFLRALPVTALVPLFLIIFGIGDTAKIAIAFLPTFLLTTVHTRYGVVLATPERRYMARVFGATNWQVFSKIVAPDALPQIFIGLRLALSLSLIAVVVSEMFIGSELGIGQRIYDSYLTNAMPTLYSLIVIVGLLGYGLNKVMLLFERRFVFWTGR